MGAITTVQRVGAAAGITSAVLSVATLVGFLVVVGEDPIGEAATETTFFIPTVMSLAAIIMLGIALVALFLAQREVLSRLGIIGFVVALIGTMLGAGATWTYVFVLPYFAQSDPQLVSSSSGTVLVGFVLSYGVMALGWTMFAIATLRARVFSRGLAIFLIVGSLTAVVPMPSRTLLLSLAVGLLGRRLLAAQPR